MWPSNFTLTMTLTLNFQGQIWNLLYLSQKWSDCYETQMWPLGLTWTITLTFEFWRSNVNLTFDHTWPWPWIFMVKFWNSWMGGPIDIALLGGGSRSFMTMTMTIWWTRSGVWIYQIVTGVTHQVIFQHQSVHTCCQVFDVDKWSYQYRDSHYKNFFIMGIPIPNKTVFILNLGPVLIRI